MKIMQKDIAFGLIVSTREFFNPKLAQTARKQLLKKLDVLGYPYEAISKYMKWDLYCHE